MIGQNRRRSCAHKSIVDERTNGQTDERTGYDTPISHLHANAGATKMNQIGGKNEVLKILTKT